METVGLHRRLDYPPLALQRRESAAALQAGQRVAHRLPSDAVVLGEPWLGREGGPGSELPVRDSQAQIGHDLAIPRGHTHGF